MASRAPIVRRNDPPRVLTQFSTMKKRASLRFAQDEEEVMEGDLVPDEEMVEEPMMDEEAPMEEPGIGENPACPTCGATLTTQCDNCGYNEGVPPIAEASFEALSFEKVAMDLPDKACPTCGEDLTYSCPECGFYEGDAPEPEPIEAESSSFPEFRREKYGEEGDEYSPNMGETKQGPVPPELNTTEDTEFGGPQEVKRQHSGEKMAAEEDAQSPNSGETLQGAQKATVKTPESDMEFDGNDGENLKGVQKPRINTKTDSEFGSPKQVASRDLG